VRFSGAVNADQNSFPMQADEILQAWSAILLDFPLYRLSFTNVVYKIPLILLSNTDAIHIETFEEKKWSHFYSDFTTALKSLFLL
jgi:putative hydrolase of the HAD superfamily